MSQTTPIVLALTTALSMASGQILFKLGAEKLHAEQADGLLDLGVNFIKNPYLMTAIVLYAATILLWVYVLRFLPLSIAYPLTACSYLLVPIFSYFIIGENVSLQTFSGSILIIAGIATIHLNLAS